METTTSTPSTFLPGQQVPATIPQVFVSGGNQAVASAVRAPTATGSGSGSIGPFFAVMSVLIILLVASCVVGRVVDGKAFEEDPLQSIKYEEGWVGWLRRRWRKCVVAGDLEVGRGKGVAEEKTNPDLVA